MSVAYVDTSFLLGIAFGEPGARALARSLESFDTFMSANLLVAEYRAAHLREKATVDEALLATISQILPDRPIDSEIGRVLATGYVRGADCWHLAVGLYAADVSAGELTFLTLDKPQARAAAALGFAIRA